MSTNSTELAKEALEKSLEVREENGYDFRSPLCVYDLAAKVGVTVRFTDDISSMEGVYAALKQPKIVLSSLRPLPRRNFTCAHELGHHFFGHGSTIDELREDAASSNRPPNEILADAFAGYLLMPAQAIKRAFSSRGLDMINATPEQVYLISSSFGVGYETIVDHLAFGLRYITPARAESLKKSKLPQLREKILGFTSKEPLVIADAYHAMGTIDAEVGSLILLPPGAKAEGGHVELSKEIPAGCVFKAIRPGLARVTTKDWGIMVRVSKFQYAGLAHYRHLEDTDND